MVDDACKRLHELECEADDGGRRLETIAVERLGLSTPTALVALACAIDRSRELWQRGDRETAERIRRGVVAAAIALEKDAG